MESYKKIILSIFVLLPLFTGGLAVGGLQTAYATSFSCGNGSCEPGEDIDNCPADCAECTSDLDCQGGGQICDQELFIQFECINFVCEEDSTDDCSDDGDKCNGITACDAVLGCIEVEPLVQCGDVQCGDVQCDPDSGICDVFNDNDADCPGGGGNFCNSQDVLLVFECEDGFCEEDSLPEMCIEGGDQCNAGFCDILDGCVVVPGPFNGELCDDGTGTCDDGVCIPQDAEIHVLKFNDLDGNGERDAGEEGIPGWEITLECQGQTILIEETDGDGMVRFAEILAPTDCIVSEETRPGWTATTPPRVTFELNPADQREVTFGNVRTLLETEKFYTETDKDFGKNFFGTPLPFNNGVFVDGSNESQVVSAVIHPKKGTISGYNPGQYYAVTKVTAFQDLDSLWIFEDDLECTEVTGISQWNPAKIPGGAYVAIMCDGETEDITKELVKSDDLFRNEDTRMIEAHVDDVPEGCMVFLGVKYSPGLVGEDAASIVQRSCENWEFVCLSQDDVPTTTELLGDFPIVCKSASFRDSAHRELVVTGLPAVCGDGLVTPPETCDDGNTAPGDGCNAVCVAEVCGDNIINNSGTEECDGTDLDKMTCEDQGAGFGNLACDSCMFDLSGCFED